MTIAHPIIECEQPLLDKDRNQLIGEEWIFPVLAQSSQLAGS
jgi:hypothetical protein